MLHTLVTHLNCLLQRFTGPHGKLVATRGWLRAARPPTKLLRTRVGSCRELLGSSFWLSNHNTKHSEARRIAFAFGKRLWGVSVIMASIEPPPPQQSAQPANGTKRKRETTKSSSAKFYAVRIGKTPGIYPTWDECFAQVRGFPRATFKSFSTQAAAEQFVNGDPPTSKAGTAGNNGNAKVEKWYAVQAGRVPGVYTSWQDVQDQITGWKGQRFKSFKTRAEAEQFVADAGSSHTTQLDNNAVASENGEPAAKKPKSNAKSRKSNGIKDEASPAPMVEQGEYEPGEAPLGEDAEDGFDPNIILDPDTGKLRYRTREEREKLAYVAVRPVASAPIRIYTDGSSLGNGQNGAIAGVGVYFGPGDGRNVSEPLAGTRQTNQRAELTAVVRALEIAPKDRKVIIVSDSKYAIDCVTDWFHNWQRNNWVNSQRKPVENRDLVQKILDLLEERIKLNWHRVSDDEAKGVASMPKKAYWDRGPGGVLFEWVKGHNKDECNNAADRLAVAGARTAQELDNAGADF